MGDISLNVDTSNLPSMNELSGPSTSQNIFNESEKQLSTKNNGYVSKL